MDLTYLGQWAFSTKAPGAKFGPLCDLTIYIHSQNLTMNNNCLNNRNKDYNVYIYTVQNTLPSGINNCNFTIYKGIPHAFVEGYEAPTCTEEGADGYTIDCPCEVQLNGTIEVQKYVNSVTDYEMVVYESVIIPATGHKEGTITNIAYENGYLDTGIKTCICGVCGVEYVEDTPSAEAMFIWLGYSMPEDGTLKLAIGFSVNVAAVSAYEMINGVTLEYGVVAAVAERLGGKAPLDESLENASVIKTPVIKTYVGFDFIISGFSAEMLDLELVMAAYVTENGKTVYLQETQVDIPSSISINKYIADNTPANS